MKLSDKIENLINKMLLMADDRTINLQRNELANQLGCAPSQINYVITTRFTNEHGYIVHSKRGGGGYISITQKRHDDNNYMMHMINEMGDSISLANAVIFIKKCLASELITEQELKLMMAAVSDNTLLLQQPAKDILRAKILKNMLVSLL